MVFHAPFGISFQLANDTHINKLPLNECKQALQAFVKAAQNVYEEITIWGKEDVGLQREVDFNTLERNLYKYAYLGLLEKIDAQFGRCQKPERVVRVLQGPFSLHFEC